MRRTSTLGLIAVALLYLLGLQLVRYERAAARESTDVAAAIEPTAPAGSAAHPEVRERRWQFGGYPCRGDDCSDDWAGYRWAEANGIADPDDCTGKTGFFIEGCRVYARQRTARRSASADRTECDAGAGSPRPAAATDLCPPDR